MTAGPSAGPASAYPTLRRPASICFSGPNDVFVPGLIGFILLDCAPAEPIMASSAAAMVRTAVPKRRRRSWSISSDILSLHLGSKYQRMVREAIRRSRREVPARVALAPAIVGAGARVSAPPGDGGVVAA